MDTDLLDQWAIMIAREATPDEVYQASFVAIAFARGGKERKNLFRHPGGSEAGGSGLGGMTQALLPYIFQALVVSKPLIYNLLANESIPHNIDVVKILNETYEDIKKKRVHKPIKDQSEIASREPISSSSSPTLPTSIPPLSAPSIPAPVPADQGVIDAQLEQLSVMRTQMEELLKSMPKQMASSGVDPEVLEDKSYRTILILCQKPEDALNFIDLMGKRK